MKFVNSAKTILTIWACFVLVFVFLGEVSAQKNKGNKNRDLKKPTQTDGKPTTPTENTITKPDKKTESTKPDKTDTTPRKKIVVVLDFDNVSIECKNDTFGKNVATQLSTEFSKTGSYTVIEKQRIDDIFKQIKVSQDEIYDGKTAAKVGKLLSANAVILGTITECNTIPNVIKIPFLGQMLTRTVKVSLAIRLVDINTAEVQDAVRISESASDRSGCLKKIGCKETPLTQELIIQLFNKAVEKAVKKSVNELTSIIDGKNSPNGPKSPMPNQPSTPTPTPTPITPNPPKETVTSPQVASVDGTTVYLVDLEANVKVGNILSVMQGKEFPHPVTGKVIFDGKEIAKVKVIEIGDGFVKAQIIKGSVKSPIQVKDRVKLIQ